MFDYSLPSMQAAATEGPPCDEARLETMPPNKKSGGSARQQGAQAQVVFGARPWVHAAYCSAMLAMGAQLFLIQPEPTAMDAAEGWGGAAGSVGSAQSQCPTWSRPRVPETSGTKGNTVISIDPRCFRNPFMDVHTFDTGLSRG